MIKFFDVYHVKLENLCTKLARSSGDNIIYGNMLHNIKSSISRIISFGELIHNAKERDDDFLDNVSIAISNLKQVKTFCTTFLQYIDS